MKVISIREPWASLIIEGHKCYEFRSWNTKYRGDILIHACKSCDKNLLKEFSALNLEYSSGEIIGKVTITDSIKVTKDFEDSLIKENPLVYGKTLGREGYAFKLKNPKKFDKKIKINGKLGIWNYEEK